MSAIGLGKNSIDRAYVGLSNGTIRITTDFGAHWTLASGIPNRYVTDFAVNPNNFDEAYATVSGFQTNHVFHTTDRGRHWTPASGNLPDTPVSAIAIDWRVKPIRMFVGTDVGVFTSRDRGTTWTDRTTGMPRSPIVDLRIATANNTLTAATHGRGAYRTTIPAP